MRLRLPLPSHLTPSLKERESRNERNTKQEKEIKLIVLSDKERK